METESPDGLTVMCANDIAEHRQWLSQIDKQRLKKWEDLLKSNLEAAICEAKTRKLLSDHGIIVQPNEDLSKGGPDFICTKNGKTFYVEATCISIEAATKSSGLKPSSSMVEDYDDDADYDEFKVHDDVEDYAFITKRICYELTNKKKIDQCRSVKAPCIVVVSTLHSQAGDCCFDDEAVKELLTATPYFTPGKNDEITRLENSVFLRPKKDSPNLIEHARKPVSAILLCGFGSNPPNIIGCLHPNPNYPFDRTLLPEIKFCRLTDGYQNGLLKVEWV